MADIPTLVAGLNLSPNVVPPFADIQMLNRAITNLMGIPGRERRAGTNPLWRALHGMGIRTFLGDLLTLTDNDIMAMVILPTRADPHPPPVPLMMKRKLVIIVAAYQHYSCQVGASIDMRTFPVELYDHF